MAKQMDFEGLNRMVTKDSSLWTEAEEDGHTLLHWAALAGEVPFMQRGIDAGAVVDVQAANLQTPLMWAVIRGHVDVARVLIANGANIYHKDSFGATPMILAVQHAMHALILLLITKGDRKRLLTDCDNNGCGAMHWAAYKGDLTTIKLLDYFDVDFTVLDNTKMTPLHRAVQASKWEVLELLLEKQVDPAQADSQGRTCIDLARDNNDKSMQFHLSKFLESKHKGDLDFAVGAADAESAAPLVTRKKVDPKEKQIEEYRDKAMHNAAATCWIVCVSLATFQYLTDIRTIGWQFAPTCAMLFELGVPASMGFFFLTMFSDPGIVPARRKNASGVEDFMRELESNSNSVDFSRVCTTTWVLKGPRTKYCQRTGACVEDFDHFCGWLNAAIGKGNHRQFIMLSMVEVATQIMHLILLWTAAGELVKSESRSEWLFGVLTEYPLLVLMAIVQGFTMPGVLFLMLNHLRMIALNVTTNEMINAYRYGHFWKTVETNGYPKKVFSNPFNKGTVAANCLDFWWIRRRSDLGPGQSLEGRKAPEQKPGGHKRG